MAVLVVVSPFYIFVQVADVAQLSPSDGSLVVLLRREGGR